MLISTKVPWEYRFVTKVLQKKQGSVLTLQVKGNQRVCMHVEEDDIVKMTSGNGERYSSRILGLDSFFHPPD